MTTQLDVSHVFPAVNQQVKQSALMSWQQAAQQQLAEQLLPTKKTEAWKYTPLKSIVSIDWNKDAQAPFDQGVVFQDWHEITLRIENGMLASVPDLPAGVELICSADFNEQQSQEFIEKITEQRGSFYFDALNQAALDQAYWLKVDDGVTLEKPLHFNYVQAGNHRMINTQLLIELGKGAAATVAETFTQAQGSVCFSNANTTATIGEQAHLTHYHLLLERDENRHVGRVSMALSEKAKLTAFHMAIGGVLKRKDIAIHHRGENTELSLNGVYLPTGNEIIDYHTSIDHAVPNCFSDQVFRCIAGDSSKAIFNGRIHIHPQAQKSLANMNNRNLLLSPNAEVYTKPELEIYADDVRCSHGATMAQLDEDMLFYFQSRGISRAKAEVMLSFGFINELLDALTDEPVKALLQPLLGELFSQSSSQPMRQTA
ncbi:Fe-S cluster assembly protein SufD [Reinekea thalattae]|uniref:Fe-S cluster assembly protein SufD n=1 Tax=Reinekea thalattae TaxID=2593301 RepID=UPI00164F64C2|nr:Fe-S cluster assembly protein SufD [Reinekea thalattae]